MSTSHVATYGSTVTLTATDTDGVLKKIARSVLASGVAEALDATGGTYSPTVTGVTNVSSLGTTRTHYYTRFGAIVTVHGAQIVTATGAGLVEFRLTLPVAADVASVDELTGSASADRAGLTFTGFAVFGDSTNDAASIRARVSAGGTDFAVGYSFSYEI
jgi:hypothetical protein